MRKPKTRELPRFEMRTEFEAGFQHPYREGAGADITLRFIITADGTDMDSLRDSTHYWANLKMEQLGLKPIWMERDGFTLLALQTKKAQGGFWSVVERVPAVSFYGDGLVDDKARAKAIKAKLLVPENRVEALELYDDATKYPTVIRSARTVCLKPGEEPGQKRWIMVETMAGARFRYDYRDSDLMPKSGKEVAPWLHVMQPLNDAAQALVAAAQTSAACNG